MSDKFNNFHDAIRSAGLEPPEVIRPGKLLRFPASGKHTSNRASWCLLFPDGLGGCFGDWSTDTVHEWEAKDYATYSHTSDDFLRDLETNSRLGKKEAALQKQAAKRAESIWNADSPVKSHKFRVTINNVTDMSGAAAKGFGTGLTFGLAGSTVTDGYEVTVLLTNEKGEESTSVYHHALHTTIGNKSAPFEGVSPTSATDAFATVVEQVILNFVKEMQSAGRFIDAQVFVVFSLSHDVT